MKSAEGQVMLVVLDGFGLAPKSRGNAVVLAKKPNFDDFVANYPYTTLLASGESVGLKAGEPGNSEAGHLNLGAGRLVRQEKILINQSIHDGSFFQNHVLLEAIAAARKNRSKLHLCGLLSGGQSAHSEPDHLEALLVLCKRQGVKQVYLHLFTDGRDCAPKSAGDLIRKLEVLLGNLGIGKIATIGGRYYGMDRGNNWDRTGLMYEAMVWGKGPKEFSAYETVTKSYRRGITDEFVLPTIIESHPIAGRDSVIFFNLRSDRARQMVKAFVHPTECRSDLYNCKRFKIWKRLHLATLADFGKDLNAARPAYASMPIVDCLPHYLGKYGAVHQFYVAEREKFAHVSYFFHGGQARPEPNESRQRVESAQVPTFDSVPEMSAAEITDAVIARVKRRVDNLIVANYANADMLGHTGLLRPTIRAVEVLDREMGRLRFAAEESGGTLLITADHGNAEQMLDPYTGKIDTAHTANPVPFYIIGKRFRGGGVRANHLSGASLRDAAPTVLHLLELPVPAEMTGQSLLL